MITIAACVLAWICVGCIVVLIIKHVLGQPRIVESLWVIIFWPVAVWIITAAFVNRS
jgi:hypothetical protein